MLEIRKEFVVLAAFRPEPGLHDRPEFFVGARPLTRGVKLPEGKPRELRARIAEQPLGDVIPVEHGAVRIHPEDAGRRPVDGAAIARLLLEELLLPSLHEEVGDVEDALLELLGKQPHERRCSLAVVGVFALERLREELREAHLHRKESGRRETRDEAPARVGAQVAVGLHVARVGHVSGPAGHGRRLIGLDARPVALRDPERRTDFPQPAVDDRGGGSVHEGRQGLAQNTMVGRDLRQAGTAQIARNALQMGRQCGIEQRVIERRAHARRLAASSGPWKPQPGPQPAP